MSLPTISDVVKALELRASTAFAVLLASGILVVSYANGFPYLSDLPRWFAGVLVVCIFGSGGVLVARGIEEGVRRARRRQLRTYRELRDQQKEATKAAHKQQRLEYIRRELATLSDRERKSFAYLLAHNQKAFRAAISDGIAGTLVARKLVYRAAGHFSVMDFPHLIHDDVWEELERERDHFPSAANAKSQPWRDAI